MSFPRVHLLVASHYSRVLLLGACITLAACTSDTAGPNKIKHDLALSCGANPVFGPPLKLQGGTRVALAGKPHAVVVSSGVAYVSQLDNRTIAPASLSTFAFGSGIPIGNSPLHLAFNSSRTTAYVTNFSPSVAVVDVASGTVTSQFSVMGGAYGIQVAPGDSIVWVATNLDSVFGIRTASGAIGHRIKMGAVNTFELPTDVAVCDSLVFVLSDNGLLTEFATPRDARRSVMFVGGTPQSMVIPSDNSHIYVANQDGTLDIVDFPDSTVSRTRLSGGGFGLAQSPADGRLYVTTLDGQVQVFDPQTNGKVDSFFVGGTVREIAFNPSGTVAVEANESGWVDFLTAPGIVTPPAPPHVLLSGEPEGAAISAGGAVYVALLANNRVAAATLPSFAFPQAFAVGSAPTDVAFNSSGTRAYVANQNANDGGAGSVSVIDVAAGRLFATIPLQGWNAYGLIVAPGDSMLWVTSDAIYGIQTSTGTIVRTVPVLGRANALAVRDSLLYVSVPDYRIVLEVNMRTGAVQRTLAVGGTPQGIVIAPAGDVLYIADQTGTLHFWDLVNNQDLDSVALAGPGFGIAQNPANGRLYVTTLNAGTVDVFDPSSRTKVESFAVGGIARRIAFNASGTVAVVTNESGWVDFLQN